ncbi:MAG: hypothetical protein GY714_32355 [Desulfobacterales bacterium]|nr:hypothetical protein [Desulfobacterales bacterium]
MKSINLKEMHVSLIKLELNKGTYSEIFAQNEYVEGETLRILWHEGQELGEEVIVTEVRSINRKMRF